MLILFLFFGLTPWIRAFYLVRGLYLIIYASSDIKRASANRYR